MTDQEIFDLARALVANEGKPRPRIGTPHCLVCYEESPHETPVCNGCAPHVIMAMAKQLLATPRPKESAFAQNRCRRARKSAGLSLTQAALLLGVTRDVLVTIEETDEVFWNSAHHFQIADLYGVNVPWLQGKVPLLDYAAVDKIPGGRDLPFADREKLAELLASRPVPAPKIEQWKP